MKINLHEIMILAMRATLVVTFVGALFLARWPMAFISLFTFASTFVPGLVVRRMAIRVPLPFLSATVFFIFATLFLGEALNFYYRFWWWDIFLHTMSAMGFGMAGFLFVFYLFEGDRYAAPPWAVAFIGFCMAITIGTLWEIFEFTMDQVFGTNMQKSGLMDTMGDLIVDTIGASIGAVSGFLYLKEREFGVLVALIREFVESNEDRFGRVRQAREKFRQELSERNRAARQRLERARDKIRRDWLN